jgi:hypothetical protein
VGRAPRFFGADDLANDHAIGLCDQLIERPHIAGLRVSGTGNQAGDDEHNDSFHDGLALLPTQSIAVRTLSRAIGHDTAMHVL